MQNPIKQNWFLPAEDNVYATKTIRFEIIPLTQIDSKIVLKTELQNSRTVCWLCISEEFLFLIFMIRWRDEHNYSFAYVLIPMDFKSFSEIITIAP